MKGHHCLYAQSVFSYYRWKPVKRPKVRLPILQDFSALPVALFLSISDQQTPSQVDIWLLNQSNHQILRDLSPCICSVKQKLLRNFCSRAALHHSWTSCESLIHRSSDFPTACIRNACVCVCARVCVRHDISVYVFSCLSVCTCLRDCVWCYSWVGVTHSSFHSRHLCMCVYVCVCVCVCVHLHQQHK